jgi:elongator complex protein 1
MTPTFDVLSEGPLHPADFGSGQYPRVLALTNYLTRILDAPINVGWGSKQTQFHGSLGKSAAQAPSAPLVVGVSPDDDALPRISWRGDGAFFTVSSLSPKDSSHRTLRVYDRAGELQSTSEAVLGLEHTLAWRPSGSLIASTQRFGFPGGGVGKMGRHDLVFFERNGLRHGEFAIRPPIGAVMAGDASGHRKWGYRAKDLLWSAGSDVLALWLESEIGDIGTRDSHVPLAMLTRPVTQFSSGPPGTITGVLDYQTQSQFGG